MWGGIPTVDTHEQHACYTYVYIFNYTYSKHTKIHLSGAGVVPEAVEVEEGERRGALPGQAVDCWGGYHWGVGLSVKKRGKGREGGRDLGVRKKT